MGIGPWDQQALANTVRKSERARFRRMLKQAKKELEGDERRGMHPKWAQQIDDMLAKITPKPTHSSRPKKMVGVHENLQGRD